MGSMLLWLSSGRLQPCTTTFVAAAARFLHFFFHSVIRKKVGTRHFTQNIFFDKMVIQMEIFVDGVREMARPLSQKLSFLPRCRSIEADAHRHLFCNLSKLFGESRKKLRSKKVGRSRNLFFRWNLGESGLDSNQGPRDAKSTVRTQMRFRRFFLFGHFGRVDGCYIYPLEGN